MKNRLLAPFVLFLLFFLTHVPTALAVLRAEPVAKTPAFLRDKFATDLFTGGAVYSYPITVPKGTNDLTPDVSLTYNSLGSRDFATVVGTGWQLPMDYIERDVNFTPNNTSDDKFKLHFKG